MSTSKGDSAKVKALRAQVLEEIRNAYPPILTTAHVAELMHSTIGDIRDKVHRGELPAVRWGQQFRFFREEVLATLEDVSEADQEITDN